MLDISSPKKCLFCSFENPVTAHFCQNCGSSLSTPHLPTPENRLHALRQTASRRLREKMRLASARIEGERKPVTILFTDIVGSTGLAERLDPEEWKEVVNGAHRIVSEAVYHYEGTIAQLLGDGVLAFFGAPITHENDPERAVRASLDIQRALMAYRQELEGYIDDFQMRIGITTGLVVVGAVGDDLHMEYLAIGDSVNLAARLQSAAEPGTVLISAATAHLVKSTFNMKDLGELSLKGKADPVGVYEVLGLRLKPENERGIAGLSSPLVGRDSELNSIRNALTYLEKGRGGIVFIFGEAGIGKTRLVEEAQQQFCQLRWLEGRSLSYGSTFPYWTITQIIKHDLGLSDGDPEARVKVALRRRSQALFGPRAVELLPYLEHLLGLRLEGQTAERVSALDSETLKHQTQVVLVRYFATLVEQRPTVLVFEDLHWADASSLETLTQLFSLTDRAPLLMLLLARLEREHGSWRLKFKAETDYAHRFSQIQLQPLSDQESNRLMYNLLELAELSETSRRLILDRAEGNPFYLEEVIRSLIDKGALIRDDHHWQLRREIREVEIPDTLQGVLLARLDRLEEQVRRTLQLAAVIGKSFLYRLLQAIAEDERELDDHLAQLQRVDLIREQARLPELEYVFKHSLTLEAAYSSLLVERRQEFHRRVGEALEDLFPERQGELLGLLAHHFDLAGEASKAAEYLLQVGDKARLEYALEAAERNYLRAAELLAQLGDEARAAQTWLKLGLVYHANFDFEAAYQANETAFALQQNAQPIQPRLLKPEDGMQPAFRSHFIAIEFHSLDPGKWITGIESDMANLLFAGIAEIDPELNVVPHAARSWQVLDGGTRYLIHLRDDVRWTDGETVTAPDYEWAWKRNLLVSHYRLLDDVVGAQDYRLGRHHDPGAVGVRALEPLTLEVRLNAPVAYFPYIFALPLTFPQPRHVIEQYGDDWWRPEHILTNGAFRLVALDFGQSIRFERNPGYFGTFSGNLKIVEWHFINDEINQLHRFQQGELDCIWISSDQLKPELASAATNDKNLITWYLALAPQPPLDDIRVRRALIHALDRNAFSELLNMEMASGGLVPPGIPGHSPELGLSYNPTLARELLAEAGYPDGRGFPVLCGRCGYQILSEYLERQWAKVLSVQVKLERPIIGGRWDIHSDHLYSLAWMADYPDPDSFLRQPGFLEFLRDCGWNDATYEELVKRASQTPERAQRMALYRQADQYLVNVHSLVIPLAYSDDLRILLQPWVTGFRPSSLGLHQMRSVQIIPRQGLA